MGATEASRAVHVWIRFETYFLFLIRYTSPQHPDYVDYVDFSDYIESIFTLKRKSLQSLSFLYSLNSSREKKLYNASIRMQLPCCAESSVKNR